MKLYIDPPSPKRKSVGRVDGSKPKKRTSLEQTAEALGVANFLDDLTSKRVVKGVQGESVDLILNIPDAEAELFNLIKADNSHLPKGAQRFAYKTDTNYNVIYIPVNRLRQVYQTDDAINPKKVKENREKMRAGIPLKPVEIGYNYDVHDGHHRWKAAIEEGHTHVPCKVVGINPEDVKDAIETYKEVWKSVQGADLFKGMGGAGRLNFAKLVKKAVQVRGKDGKVYTRQQWVNPEQASTGHGVRKISTAEDFKEALGHGIQHHPDAKQAMAEQGIDPANHSFKHHPHFFLPETKESADHARFTFNHHPHGERIRGHKVYEGDEILKKQDSYTTDKDKKMNDAYAADTSSSHQLKHLDISKLGSGAPLISAFRDKIQEFIDKNGGEEFEDRGGANGNLFKYYHELFKGVTKEGIEHAFSHPDGLFTADLDTFTPSYDKFNDRFGAKIGMVLRDADGRRMGTLERGITKAGEGDEYPGLIVKNHILEMDTGAQGMGVGKHIYERSEDLWRHMADDKDTHIFLTANISVGTYAWAKKGFEFENPDHALDKQYDLQRFLKAHGLPVAQTIKQCGFNSLSDIKTIKDFADLKCGIGFNTMNALKTRYDGESDQEFERRTQDKDSDIRNEDVELGKAFLLAGTGSWKGYKRLRRSDNASD